MEIVCLQDGNSSTSAFFLPTVAGSVSSYFELGKALGPGHRVYGIQCADRLPSGEFRQFASLHDMAAAIATELLAQHRDGPICLIGYSFAAVLAIELARQLIGHGKSVPLVVMIDRTAPSVSFPPLLRTRHFAKTFGAWALRLASRVVTDPKSWSNYRQAMALKLRGRHKFEAASWYEGLPREHQNYVSSNLANLRRYRFEGVYRGTILLFSQKPPAGLEAHPFRLDHLQGHGWKSATGANVEVMYAPGDHASMMQHPNVEHIANAVRQALDACDRAFQRPALTG